MNQITFTILSTMIIGSLVIAACNSSSAPVGSDGSGAGTYSALGGLTYSLNGGGTLMPEP
jgi:hypothetical protein